jgi:glycosyltransferase involved in cell wall biosynthesis
MFGRSTLRITHLSKWDLVGGAARAAFRLHEGLRMMGQESRVLAQHQQSRDPSVAYFAPPLDATTRVRRILRRTFLKYSRKLHYSRKPSNATFFSDDRSEHLGDVLRQALPTDILHLHWVAELIDYSEFFLQVRYGPPVVWTLHDMNPFTGGCHHSGACRKFVSGCGACPQLGSLRDNDFSNAIWSRKRSAYKYLEPGKFSVVTPSRWLASEARQSELLGHFPISVIPYGLDTESFAPRDRGTARDVLGISHSANVLLFVSTYLDDKYKGLPLLLEAINQLRPLLPDLFLLIIGLGEPLSGLRVPNKVLGYFTDEKLLSLVYSAADIFALPSVADNFPNTALEALACGLPVVAFDVGGISEIVRHNCTGVLVEPGNSQAFSRAIKELMDDPGRRLAMSANCRRIALEEYASNVQVRRYIELYESMLGKGYEAVVTANVTT